MKHILCCCSLHRTRVLQGAQAGARPSANTIMWRDLVTLKSPTRLSTGTSQTPQRRRRANPAGIGCGGQRRSTRRAVRAVEGSRLAEARAVGSAHVAICVFSVSVSVGVPEASAAHAHALPPLLADDDLRSRCGGVSGAGISPVSTRGHHRPAPRTCSVAAPARSLTCS